VSIVKIDEKGRIALPEKVIESLKLEKVLVVNAGDHVQLVPIPADPLKVLNGALSTGRQFKELRAEAELLLEKETL
jgi:DNA-binding transcriptional regulator/RsmH inhibitor MraZ